MPPQYRHSGRHPVGQRVMPTLQLPAFAQLTIVALLNKELNSGLCVDKMRRTLELLIKGFAV